MGTERRSSEVGGAAGVTARFLREQRELQELVNGGAITRWMRGQKDFQAWANGGPVRSGIRQQEELRELVNGGPLARMLADQKRWQQLFGGPSALTHIVEVQKRWAALTDGARVMRMIQDETRQQKSLGFASALPRSMSVPPTIAGPALAVDTWASVLADAGVADPDVVDDVLSEVRAAEAEIPDDTSELWWVERLSFARQFGLFCALMEALHRIADYTNSTISDGLPDTYFKAVDALVALAVVLIVLMETEAREDEE